MRIKSSKHSLKYTNFGKSADLCAFLGEYRDAVEFYVDYLWKTRIEWDTKKNEHIIFDIKKNFLNIPKFILTSEIIPDETKLSGRAIKSASMQAIAMVSAAIAKRKKQFFILSKMQQSGTHPSNYKKLQQKIDKFPLVKPTVPKHLSANLDSNCVMFERGDTSFDGFLVLRSIGKSFGKIALPIKFTKHCNRMASDGWNLKTSWLIGQNYVDSRWEKEATPTKSEGVRIGADQGAVTCLSLSDGQVTTKNSHGYDLRDIMMLLSRRKKNSKGFKRAQEHRTNYINWSINNLDFSNINELAFEEVKDIRKFKKSSAFLSRWTYTEIASKVKDKCLEDGVHLVEQSSTYRSQRCSSCGFVHKLNRKGKLFTCRECGTLEDSDVNGALNHEAVIPDIPYSIRQMQLNRKGFFWTPSGLFDISGAEITVPHVKNIKL